MSLKNLIYLVIFVFIAFNYLSKAQAQDTFGPVCDDVTVTCAPTASPTPGGPTETPSLTPTPSLSPTPAPPTPTELPRAGITDSFNYLILLSLILIIAGSISHIAFASKK